MKVDTGKAYYYALQSEARKRVMNTLNAKILRTKGALQHFDRLTLSSILSPDTPDALQFVREKWDASRPPHFPGFARTWENIALSAAQDPDSFDLAIWQEVDGEQVLAALAMATPSRRHTHLTVRWVEKYYGKTHVSGRVLLIVLACAEEYAKLLDCERVLIKDPLVPALYERYGYRSYRHPYVAHGGNYLAKEIESNGE